MKKVQRHNKVGKRILAVFAAVTVALGVGVSLGPKEVVKAEIVSPYTFTFEGKKFDENNQTKALGEVNWTFIGEFEDRTPLFGYDGTKGQQFGTAANYASKINFSTSDISEKISKVKIETSGAASINANVGVKVGEVVFFSSEEATKTITATNTEYSFSGLASGKIDIEWNNSSEKGIYIKKITVLFGEDGDPDPTSINVTAAGNSTSVKANKTLQLNAIVNPSGAVQTVTWSSSNELVATVSDTGLVTGVGEGSVVITATSTELNTIKGTISLTVPEPVVYDGEEDFETQTALTASYSGGLFVGSSGVTFNYGNSRNEGGYAISGKGFMLRRASDSYLEFTLPNGLSFLEFEYRRAFTSAAERQLELVVNSVVVQTGEIFGTNDDIFLFVYAPEIPHTGNTTIRIKNVGTDGSNKQTTIDNIGWINGPESSFGIPESLAINTDGVQTSYYEGEKLSLNGLVAIAYDTNGLSENVTTDITSNPAADYVFVAADAVSGTKKITITYTRSGVSVSADYNVEVKTAHSFSKITSPMDFHLGGIYTFGGVKNETVYVMSITQNPNNRVAIPAVIENSKVMERDDVQKVEVVEGVVDGTYGFKIVNGSLAGSYLSANGKGRNNYLTSKTILDESGSWKVAFDKEGKITIIAADETYNNHLRFNAGSSLFSAYPILSTMSLVSLYIDDSFVVTDEHEAHTFAMQVMYGSGNLAEDACHSALSDLEEMYSGLSIDAQLKFENNPNQLYVDARARLNYLRAWVAVNQKANPSSAQNQNENNALVAALVIGVVGMTTLGGYIFLNKRKEKYVK